MWPWGHAAVGYLLFTLWSRIHYHRPPLARSAVAVAFGTQFPDLIDKPLAWTLGVSPSGRAGAHSLLAAIPILIVLWWYFDQQKQHDVWAGFAVGYLAHIASDGIFSAFAGEFGDLGYLLWPVTALPDYTESSGILTHFATLTFTPQVIGEFALFALATIVWIGDGAPGLRGWYRWLTNLHTKRTQN